MPTRKSQSSVTTKTADPPDIRSAQVGGLALLASLFSFFYYFQHNGLLFYGDAVAHINIARRVFDSQTPGLLQLGTVWLPLPHLLMIPFVVSNKLWQSGAGGSFPSMIAYVFGVVGIFRLVRGLLTPVKAEDSFRYEESVRDSTSVNAAATLGAWTAAVVYGANPNLIYMQVTAMTESLYLCLFVWSVVFFTEFLDALRTLDARKLLLPGDDSAAAKLSADAFKVRLSLTRCAYCLAAAELTRYDGWFLAGAMGAITVVIALQRERFAANRDRTFRKTAAAFLLAIAVVPILWLAYNRLIYGNALEFATGSYSAKAIEARVNAPNPALHNPGVAAIYFLKSAQLNMSEGNWGRLWLAAAMGALIFIAWKMRAQVFAIFLLWTPLAFYALSIAYGSVPIHVSTWWPFATFNQRYGLQLLPVLAVSGGIFTASCFRMSAAGRHRGKLVAVLLALIVASYASVWKAKPQCFLEAQKNWIARYPLNAAVQRVITHLPPHSVFLMDLSEHVGIMEAAAIPLRQVINSENRRLWRRPTDPDGLWERALANPEQHVDFVIAFDGDMVDRLVNKSKLSEFAEIHTSQQSPAKIYATHRTNQSR
jgi:hypothetical protein